MVLGDNGFFKLADGFQVRRVPGMIAFGELREDLGNPNHGFVTFATGSYNNINMDDFTSLTIVFAPNGSVVKDVNGGPVVFYSGERLFDPMFPETFLWDRTTADGSGTPEYGVGALVMFEYDRFVQSLDRPEFLKANGRLIPLNLHTGQLFE
jgi:hypothetical protein